MIEQLEANFDQFYRDNIKEILRAHGNDLEMAEEALEDAWVDQMLESGRVTLRQLEDIL